MHAIDLIMVSILTFSMSEDLKKSKISYLALMVDLDFQGQTIFFQTYCLFDIIDFQLVRIDTKNKSVSYIQ